ncbi:MAG: hypothetical protein AAB415_02510 [Patescibacteria group bacterium]
MTTMINKKADFALKSLVLETVSGVLSDPDYGLEVQELFAKKLLSKKRNSGEGISLVEAKKKYL